MTGTMTSGTALLGHLEEIHAMHQKRPGADRRHLRATISA
jgi:hypothetical protein